MWCASGLGQMNYKLYQTEGQPIILSCIFAFWSEFFLFIYLRNNCIRSRSLFSEVSKLEVTVFHRKRWEKNSRKRTGNPKESNAENKMVIRD